MNADANPTLQLSDAVVPPTPEIIRNNSTSPGVRRANSLVKSGKGPTTPVSKGAGNGGPLQKSKNREPGTFLFHSLSLFIKLIFFFFNCFYLKIINGYAVEVNIFYFSLFCIY